MAAISDSKAPLEHADVEMLSSSENSSDLDDSYEVFKKAEGLEYDESEAKKVLRKIDMRIVPVLFMTYLLQYLDKNAINYSSVYGLKQGTHLHGDQYSWLNSIFYFGYLVAQYPSGYIMQRFPIGKFLSLITFGWGLILITTPACYNFAGIAVNRFMLGLVEAAINPGFVLVMGLWYTSAEQPLRLEAYYCTNGLATMVGGLIGYAIGHITTGTLARWQYVFIIFGAVSIAWAAISFLLLPDLPSTAKFLTERERAIAVHRVAKNRQGVKNTHFKKDQAWQCLADPKTWILFIMAVGAQVPNSALTSVSTLSIHLYSAALFSRYLFYSPVFLLLFRPLPCSPLPCLLQILLTNAPQFTSIIIKTFGYDTLGTQYLQIPGGFVQFAALLGGGIVCTKFPNSRCITMIVANLICILGAALLVGLPDSNKWGRLVALWLCYFQGLGFSMSLTMVSSNVSGYTKKQLTGAAIFTGYCVGNIIGPQTFRDSEAPGYHSAYIAMLVGYVVKLLSVVALYAYMWSVNKKRDREAAAAGPLTEEQKREAVELGMKDLTEIDNKGFRYTL
ncbi:major facilitator superfamily domain-containing protein [Phyllosticta paracitricarpa]|uniref:Major facilitator superfamily domain-containing protein n=2 Tax=Phyllosticta TaxID=121621 RepID=A0ABR1LM74_9PEZI